MNNQLRANLIKIKNGLSYLLETSDQEFNQTLHLQYPFKESFEDIAPEIIQWIDNGLFTQFCEDYKQVSLNECMLKGVYYPSDNAEKVFECCGYWIEFYENQYHFGNGKQFFQSENIYKVLEFIYKYVKL